MNKLNLLSKLAIGTLNTLVLSASIVTFTSSSAMAVVSCGSFFSDDSNDLQDCEEGGKEVTGLNVVGSPFTTGGGQSDQIQFEFEDDVFVHTFGAEYLQGGLDDSELSPLDYEVQYAVNIQNVDMNDPDQEYFSLVELDADTIFGIDPEDIITITKNVYRDSDRTNLIDSIVSTNGSSGLFTIDPNEKLTTLYVTDIIDGNGETGLRAYDNAYGQDPADIKVPEPGTILGLLAVGGLGLGLKGKKQS